MPLPRAVRVRVLAVAVLSLFATGCPPSVDGSSRPADLASVRRIAVRPFQLPREAPASLARGMADDLSARLSGTFRIVEGGEAASDVDAVLLGTVVEYRDQATTPDVETALAVTVRLIDLRSREDVLSASTEASAAASLCAEDMACLRAKVTAELARWLAERAAGVRRADDGVLLRAR